MKVEVLNIQGEKTGRTVELPDNIFGIEPNEHAVYLAVKHYQASQRQGTHKAKERNEIAGSTKKIKRQKGTGTARFGDIKNPIFRGGGRIFGPRPRDYRFHLNKKTRRLARKSALSSKAGNGDILVVEDFSFDSPKTREYLSILRNFELSGVKSTLVTSEYEREVFLSGRNLKNSQVVQVSDLNTYQILDGGKILFSEGAIEKLKANLV